MMTLLDTEKSSFRDPSGFLFYENGKLFRQVNQAYHQDYDLLFSSGLYDKLIAKNLLVKHVEKDEMLQNKGTEVYKIIEPEFVKFISYPYEWSFNQLKDAAIVTLRIQKIALKHGMSLKDASAYNIQFHNGQLIFIDTLSFETYQEGKPWVAYKQFCQHFLAPLALMSYTDLRLNQLLKIYIDGVPLDLASKLLPNKTKVYFSLLMHLHLHASAQKKYEKQGTASKNTNISSSSLLSLIESLLSTIRKLKNKKQETEWGEYYTFTNYSDTAFLHKKEIITDYLKEINPQVVWDLGANMGEFTQIGCNHGAYCIAFDIDPVAVDINYLRVKKGAVKNMLPLVMDLTNPSPALGWDNTERKGFKERPKPNVIFALAIIHHIAISNNVPIVRIAEFFSQLSENLIIEFVPKSDSKVKILLESRVDIFPRYNIEDFVKDFETYYEVIRRVNIKESDRVLFWMKKK